MKFPLYNYKKIKRAKTPYYKFLDFIYKYDKDSYLKLPGLLKKHLYFALLQKLQRQKSVVPTAMLNQTDVNGQSLVEPSDGNRLMDEFYLKAQLSAALNKLTPKQRDFIESTYLAGYSLTEYAEHNRITLAAACLLQTQWLWQQIHPPEERPQDPDRR